MNCLIFSLIGILSTPVYGSWFGTPPKKPELASTRIYLTRPEHTTLRINALKGSVTLHPTTDQFLTLRVPPCSDDILAQIKNAVVFDTDTVTVTSPAALSNHAIHYTFFMPAHITAIEVTQQRGSITLWVPQGYAATVYAKSTKGAITSAFPLSVTQTGRTRELQGIVGTGGAPLIRLETKRGAIHLKKG